MEIEFQRFMAFGRVAHAYCPGYWLPFQTYMAGGGYQFPLGFKVVGGRAYITRNNSQLSEIQVGDELTRIQNVGFPELRPRLLAYLSADNLHLADTLLEQQAQILVWFELGSRKEFSIEIRKGNGAIRTLKVQAVTWNDINSQAASNQAVATDWNQRTWRMLGPHIGYLRPGPFYNLGVADDRMYDTSAFASFVDAAFRGLIDANARALLVDLRNNPGGDSSFSDLMVSWIANKPFKFASDFRIKVSAAAIESNRKRLEASSSDAHAVSAKLAAAYANRKSGEVFSYQVPFAQPREGQRFTGKCYLLVNRYSLSNAVSVAALMQDYGFAKLLGEETADLATSYGAMEQFKLSRTGITVGFPKALIIRPSGSMAPRGVIPDLPIKTPLLDDDGEGVLGSAVDLIARG